MGKPVAFLFNNRYTIKTAKIMAVILNTGNSTDIAYAVAEIPGEKAMHFY